MANFKTDDKANLTKVVSNEKDNVSETDMTKFQEQLIAEHLRIKKESEETKEKIKNAGRVGKVRLK